ncbi:MAG: hypothetical protein ACM31C_33375 [Acidobacteriota bacterium]
MHVKAGSRLILAIGVVVALAMPRPARAQVTDSADCPTSPPSCSATRTNCCTTNPAGSSGAVLIPLDRCHQRNVASQYAPTTSNNSPYWCSSPTTSYNNAMYEAFGLAYRMMQWSAINPTQPIPFYWIVNPTKAPSSNSAVSDTWTEKDVDLWVLATGASPPASGAALTSLAGTSPVKRLKDNGSGTLITDTSWGSSGLYTRNEFPLRGSAFYIPAQYRSNFNAFWQYYTTVPTRTGCGNGKNCWDFTDVAVYEVDSTAHFAWQDFTQALSGGKYVLNDNQLPVSMVVNYPPPKIAAIMSGTDMSNWLAAANLSDFATNSSCASGTAFAPSDSIACSLTPAQVDSGNLVSGGFTWAWFESTATSCAEAAAINAFLTGVNGVFTAGNAFFFNESISNLAEACGVNNMLGSSTGIASGGNVNETAPTGNPSGNPIIVRWPSNLFAQYGDMPLNFAAGTVPSLVAKSATGTSSVSNLYNPLFYSASSSTLRRLMTWETACGTGSGFKGPSCSQNPTCLLHDDYGHTLATSTSTCDQWNLNTATKNGSVFVPDDDVDDIYVYGRYQNDVNNGIVFYAPGQNITQNGQAAQLRMVLSALIATPPLTTELTPAQKEITRSSPVPFIINGNPALVQGSYEYNYVSYTIGTSTTTYQVPRTFPGIYTHDDVGVFTFPGQQGHFRAIRDTGIGTSATQFSSESASFIFDAATQLASMSFSTTSSGSYDGSTRTIFTNNNDATSTTAATTILFNESNVSATIKNAAGTNTTLGELLLATGTVTSSTGTTLTSDQKTLIDRVIAGDNSSGSYKPKLGGVDRSTAAVIGASTVVAGLRPTVAYFGATDGMLHAVCADNTIGVCSGNIGKELWAFIPRVNLPNLRYNNARVDGSPRVVDMQGKFATCTPAGGSCWRTILTFQTGSGDATSTTNAQPAVYAMDISDPTAPKVLWEYATPSPTLRKTYELGVGLIAAMGSTTIGTTTTNLAIYETNNGGTGSNGVVLTAINVETGAVAWQWAYPYPSVRTAGDTALPSSGIPGGVTIVDKTDHGGNAYFDYLTFGDLYGDLWELKSDGTNYVTSGSGSYLNATGVLGATPTGTTGKPLFSFSEDYHPIGAPPAIYNNGNIMFAVFAEGGYADVSGNTGWGQNLASGKSHYGLAVSLSSPVADATFNENQTRPDILFKVALNTAASERSYSEATVVGTQVFFTTDTSSANNASYGTSSGSTGFLYSVNVAGISTPSAGSPVIAVTGTGIQSGASSVANNGTTLYASSGSTNQQIGTSALTTAGPTVTYVNPNPVQRQLWLRTE